MNKMDKLWFKRKRYGWGFTPVTWQGWSIVIGYLVTDLVFTFYYMKNSDDVVWYLVGVGVLTLILIPLSMIKAPKGKWRWGKRDDDNPEEDY